MITLTIATLVLSQTPAAPAQKPDLDKWLYPTSKPLVCPPIEIDVTEAPELKDWAERARTLAIEWYPHITQQLSMDGFKPPEKILFKFRAKQDPPAYATNNEISYKVDWVKQRPDDFGMVVHELTHIVQQYPRNKHNTGWLVEGIADYIRWWRYEPEAPRTPINFEKAKHTDAYRTTAWFLAWSSKKYDLRLVPALDKALRKAEDPEPVFKAITGKTPEELWGEFKAATGPKPAGG